MVDARPAQVRRLIATTQDFRADMINLHRRLVAAQLLAHRVARQDPAPELPPGGAVAALSRCPAPPLIGASVLGAEAAAASDVRASWRSAGGCESGWHKEKARCFCGPVWAYCSDSSVSRLCQASGLRGLHGLQGCCRPSAPAAPCVLVTAADSRREGRLQRRDALVYPSPLSL